MNKYAILLIFIIAPFGVSGLFQRLLGFTGFPTTIALLTIVVFVLSLTFLNEKKIYITAKARKIIVLFYLPILLSVAIGLPAGITFNNPFIDYGNYFSIDFIGRYFNLLLLFLFFLATCSYCISKGRKFNYKLIHAYWLGCFIMCIIGVMQAFNFYLDIPFFDLPTRSHVHSVPEIVKVLVPGRLTSLANEPSFFTPLIIDFLLLSFIIVKKRSQVLFLTSMSIIILFFTFSPAGFLNVFFLLVIALVPTTLRLLSSQKISKYVFIILISLLLSLVIVFLSGSLEYAKIVFYRLPGIFDAETHARAYMIFMPVIWLFYSNPINFLFGFGPKTYALIGNVMTLPGSDNPVHITSNNIFTDFIWESGVIGLICISYLFLYLIWNGVKNNKPLIATNWIGVLLAFHLLISSSYRGDYASIRFWVLLIIILILSDKGFKNKEKYLNKLSMGVTEELESDP